MTSSPKIVIYEDEWPSLRDRYGEILKVMPVNVFFVEFLDDPAKVRRFVEANYPLTTFNPLSREEVNSHDIQQADIYFSDGLVGKALTLMDRIDNKKLVLNTGDNDIRYLAEKKNVRAYSGIEITQGFLEKLLRGEKI
ncbi:MAG: hypothetical protein AABW73_01225 [Nanoarchaeota archaeon]